LSQNRRPAHENGSYFKRLLQNSLAVVTGNLIDGTGKALTDTASALVPIDLTDILYHRHREIIALPPPDPVVAGLG